jgi:hypothetical protein
MMEIDNMDPGIYDTSDLLTEVCLEKRMRHPACMGQAQGRNCGSSHYDVFLILAAVRSAGGYTWANTSARSTICRYLAPTRPGSLVSTCHAMLNL